MITQTELKNILDYNPETGEFIWKKNIRKILVGCIAGTVDRNKYRRININHQRYLAHRLAWFYMTGDWPEQYIDHINHNRDDNRFSNLRLATKSENSRNAKRNKNNTSGYKGVSKKGNKFIAQIWVDYKRINLGLFDTAEQAHIAYIQAAKTHFKDFAYSG